MYQFILLIHVFIAVCIIALVLVQQGKGATMGAAFGSGASQTVFGSRGSGSFLFRITASLIAAFFITSMALNFLTVHAFKQEKVITLPGAPTTSTQPALPQTTSAPVTNMPVNTNSTTTLPAGIPTRK